MHRLARILGSGLLVATLSLSAVVVSAIAQETPAAEEAESTPHETYLEALAEELGITPEELEEAMKAAQIQMIDQWAENARERVEEGGSVFPGSGGSFGDWGPGDGFGPIVVEGIGGFGGFGEGRIRGGIGGPTAGVVMRGAFEDSLTEIAGFLEMTEADLLDQLATGDSLAEIAEAQGKSVEELRAFLIEQATERIDERLAEAGTDEPGSDDAESTDSETDESASGTGATI